MHERPPNGTSIHAEVNIVMNGIRLNEVPHFTYLGSTLSNDALLDKEISARIRKASCSFGHLYGRVWNERDIKRQQRSRFIKPSFLPHFCIAVKREFSTEDTSRSLSLSIYDTYASLYRSNVTTWFRILRFWRGHILPASKRISSKLSWDEQVTFFVWKMGVYRRTCFTDN